MKKTALILFAISTLLIMFACTPGNKRFSGIQIPSAHYPAQEIASNNLIQYTIAYCWRPIAAPASVDFPEQQETRVVVSHGDGSNKFVTNQYPTSSIAFVNMLGCLSHDRQDIRRESGSLTWRPGHSELSLVYGVDPALTNFKFFSVPENLLIQDIGDPVGQNNYFINPRGVFWSPDGNKFATWATDTELDQGLGSNIWVYDMTTSQISRISNVEKVGNYVANATWSAHGDKIAVGYGVPYSGIAISTYSKPQTYTEVTSETQSTLKDWPYVIDNVLEMFSKDPIYAFNFYLSHHSLPIWVNDDSQVVFVAANRNKQAALFIVNSDGTNLHELLPGFPGIVGLPTLAPDLKTIAFIRYPDWKDRGRVEIATLDLITMEINSLAVLPAPANGDELYISGMSWTPDSQYLAFSSPHNGESDIYVIAKDGSAWLNLTKNVDGDAVSPVWQP